MLFEKYGIYDIEFPEDEGCLQSGIRPAIIIQNNIGNTFSPTAIVIPLTTKIKHTDQATHTLIEDFKKYGLSYVSMVLGEQLTSVNKKAIRRMRGKIEDRDLQRKVFKCFINAAAYGSDDMDAKEIKY